MGNPGAGVSRAIAVLIAVIMVIAGYAVGNYFPAARPPVATTTATLLTTVSTTVASPTTITTTITSVKTIPPTTAVQTVISTQKVISTITDTITRWSTITLPQQIVLRLPGEQSWPTAVVDLNGDGVEDVIVALDPWNINNYSGTMELVLSLDKRELRASFNVTDVNPATWTNGYPEIYSGRKPWDTKYVNGFGVPFPMRVGNMSSFLVSFDICILKLDPSVNFDIAADAWVVRESVMRSPGTPPAQGDLEVMVWLFSQNLNPAGTKVGEELIPIIINGTRALMPFEVWRMDSVTWGGWQYIAFRPRGWEVLCGSVAYDPTIFVKIASKYATFDISNHYLLDWEVGTEWGTYTSKGSASFEWVMRDFTMIPGASVG